MADAAFGLCLIVYIAAMLAGKRTSRIRIALIVQLVAVMGMLITAFGDSGGLVAWGWFDG